MKMAYIKNSLQAISYSKFRPTPSTDLIEKIVEFLKEKIRRPLIKALDVGCGSGQSTEVLSPYFKHVVGIDSSQEQLQQAQSALSKHGNVFYRLGNAEVLGEGNSSVDLVTVGQAVHWFDLEKFSAEVGRVLCPDGVLAIYGYNLPRLAISGVILDDLVQSLIKSSLEQYFPEGSKAVYFDGYGEEKFSKFLFSSKPARRFNFITSKKNARVMDLLGYISSMSGFQNYLKKHGETSALSLLDEFKTQIADHIAEDQNIEEIEVEIIFPYFLLLSRKDINN